MSAFTRDEIAYFREQYANQLRPNARGVDQDGFVTAISSSVLHAQLATQGVEQLITSFNRIKSSDGVVAWPQFFQALQKIRNQAPSQLGVPVAVESSVGFQESGASGGGSGGGGNLDRGRSLGRTLRRGLGTMGTAVGNWFGVMQDPGESNPLWQEDNRLEVGASLTLGRSRSVHRRTDSVSYDHDPDLGGEPIVLVSPLAHGDESTVAPPAQHASSFAFVEFESSSEEEDEEVGGDGFISAAPPNYLDVVGDAQPPRPVSMPPVDVGLGERPDITRNRASAYVMTSEPVSLGVAAARAPPTQRQDPGFVYDTDEAYRYYLDFIKKERNCLRNRAHRNARSFFGGDGAAVPAEGGDDAFQRNDGTRGSVRRDRISNRRGLPKLLRRRNRKLARQSTSVRQEVESLPTFFPFFILLITVVQIIAFIVMAILNGIAPVNIHLIEQTITVDSLSEINGTITKPITLSTNLWVGPRIVNLIQWGAKFKPCMRGDDQITARSTQDTFEEAGPLGCCAHAENFGSVVSTECAGNSDTVNISAIQAGNFSGSSYVAGTPCSEVGLPSTFHPCCVSVTGACVVVSEEECTLRGGFYHAELDSCRDINCLRDVCGFFGAFVPVERPITTPDGNIPSPNQFWRWVTPLFFHMGIIHLVIVLVAQLYLGIKIERFAGWLRVILIYFISGVGGLLLSAIFVPYEVYFGASGAVCGLLGVFLVELLQTWKINDYAWLELIIFIVVVVILAFLGTLPYVDNFVHIGGFVFGILSAMIFLPWVTFSKYTKKCRCIVLLISAPVTLLLIVFAILVFYLLPDSQSNFCPWCHYVNCIPYFPGLCDITNPAPSSENLTTIGL